MIIDRKKIFIGLIAAMILQLTVLLMEYAGATYPLITGKEIKLKVNPVDPRSLFRGNYARLRYEIGRMVPFGNSRTLRKNETVYVTLKPGKGGLYEGVSASLSRPESGIFIKGRYGRSGRGGNQIRFGIEAFFAPEEKAKKLEKRLRSGGIAVVMLAENGKATLKDVIPKP